MNVLRRAAAWSSLVMVAVSPVLAQEARQARADVGQLTALWDTARHGDFDKLDAQLVKLDKGPAADLDKGLTDAASSLSAHIAKREKDRETRITEVRGEIDKALEPKPETDVALSKALRGMIELHMLSIDKDAVLKEPKIKGVIERSAAAAHAAEQKGDVVSAGELFVLLDALLDVPGTYKEDVRRLMQRQEMLRLYAPELLYKQRQDRQKAAGEEALPEYNPFGDDWRTKLSSIDASLVTRAIAKTRQHVEQKPMSVLLTGGLEAIKTMVTTKDLQQAFKDNTGKVTTRLGDAKARETMLAYLGKEQADLAARVERNGGNLDQVQVEELISRVSKQNDDTVKIPTPALLHEFGNGVMSKLDEFSAIIWPDEVRRFEKNTQGRFVGIGVQIEYDELFNIRVVTPLEGTPAQRAGIHPKDIIEKVDGKSILGLSLDQAVEVITGPEGTSVTLTLRREKEPDNASKPGPEGKPDSINSAVEDDQPAGDKPQPAKPAAKDDKPKEEVDVKVTRSVITVPTVKGWKREGVREDSWDWFIDPDNHIGYVRLLQFSESTSRELDRAIAEMKRQGLSGLILDLRFNPGGLLDQAVKVSRKFIKVPDSPIVMTQAAGGMIEPPETTRPAQAVLADVPLVVLINEGSASASEIVSGALETYAHQGDLDAVVLGARSYGKGSVQNVWPIGVNASAAIKVTTAYYMLPDKRIIHRRPGALTWGVEPDLKVEMLPKQTADALNLRRNADVVPLDEHGLIKTNADKAPDPDDLIAKGVDLQLETGLMLLRAKAVASAAGAEGSAKRGHAAAVK